MNYAPLGIKTDYSLLNSLIKIDDLISISLKFGFNAIGIIDNNLFSSYEFYKKCNDNNIKPIIGLDLTYNNLHIYLYAKNYSGLVCLFKIHDIKEEREINLEDLKLFSIDIITVIPYESYGLYNELKLVFDHVFLSYKNDQEMKNASIITDKLVYINETIMINKNDNETYMYLKMIENGTNIDNYVKSNYSTKYLYNPNEINEIDSLTTSRFASLFNLEWKKEKNHLPKYEAKINDNNLFLKELCIKGLRKRLGNEIEKKYLDRLLYELSVINEMGFVDYFLIVYDYVLYAKKNNILTGPGRGSAAGSLVSYSLGITSIDPVKYNLLFERFLNKDRITMPDIDLDFEDVKRDQIKEYLKDKYGYSNVASIITFSTLGSKQVIRDVLKIFNYEEKGSFLLKEINANISLKNNYDTNKKLVELLNINPKLKEIFAVSLKLEGLKKQISTHAAGVVIADESLNNLIPMTKSGESLLTGITMEYLEELGLLKMDLLALNNLTIIHNCLDLIIPKLDLNNIPLDDEKTLDLFKLGKTDNIFQFESEGMKSFLKKLKPSKFSDLYAAVALYRPGPMDNIDLFIERKQGKQKLSYLHPDLESILEETYGIIVYQEQIIQILTKMAGYSLSESDLVRKSMSKKNYELLSHEKEKFISGCLKNNYSNSLANEVFDLILKFASYGFNKAHSVSYALISYQLAYLKANYPLEFMTSLLNMSLGSINKTKEYIAFSKQMGIKISNLDILKSKDRYYFENNTIFIPLTIIKGINPIIQNKLQEISNQDNLDIYSLFIAFKNKGIGNEIIVNLIKSGALDGFELNRQTLLNNLDKLLNYAELVNDLDASLVSKPIIENYKEMENYELLQNEIDLCGFYLSNHPTTIYYTDKMIKMIDVLKYFDKNIICVVLIDKIKKIKTKKGEDMVFISASDETGNMELILFPSNIKLIDNIRENIVVIVNGKVTKKNDRYGIIINSIKNIKE